MSFANGTRRLVLLRHAKAEPAGSVGDQFRPLALQGRRQAVAIGEKLSGLGVEPQKVFCSAALRTRQTWELVSNGLDLDASFAQVEESLYLAAAENVLDVVRGCEEPDTILVVGHEPVMSSLAAHLAGPGTDAAVFDRVRIGLPTSGFAILESDLPWSEWDAGTALLVSTDSAEV